MNSGIYSRVGSENKDMITEATAQEFKDWMASLGLNISFMRDKILDGYFYEKQEPFRQWQIRCAFVADAQAKGITIYKLKSEWEDFVKAYEEEATNRYG